MSTDDWYQSVYDAGSQPFDDINIHLYTVDDSHCEFCLRRLSYGRCDFCEPDAA